MEQQNSNSIARDFSFRFLFQLQAKGGAKIIETLKETDALKKSITEFQLIYGEQDDESQGQQLTAQASFFSNRLIEGVIENYQMLYSKVSTSLTNKKIESLDRVDLTILLLGSFEILKIEETPTKVALNEYIEMAKKYGRAESKSFINGILDNILKNA